MIWVEREKDISWIKARRLIFRYYETVKNNWDIVRTYFDDHEIKYKINKTSKDRGIPWNIEFYCTQYDFICFKKMFKKHIESCEYNVIRYE